MNHSYPMIISTTSRPIMERPGLSRSVAAPAFLASGPLIG